MISATTAVAATSIKTVLSKASVAFHTNEKSEIVSSGAVPLLNYEDRIYVPLRLFGEKMGATVDYVAGSGDIPAHVTVDLREPESLVDYGTWTFEQNGPYAQEDHPFDVQLGSDHDRAKTVKQGDIINLTVWLTNTSDRDILVKQAQFGIRLPSKDGEIILRTEVLQDVTLPGNHGAMKATIPWKIVLPANSYHISLDEPFQIAYVVNGETQIFEAMGDMWTMSPLIVE